MNKWFRVENNGRPYYAIEAQNKTVYVPLNGKTKEELADSMNVLKQQGKSFEVFSTMQIAAVRDETDTTAKPVQLPPGNYRYLEENYPYPERLVPFELREDSYIEVSDLTSEIINDINTFLENETLYRDLNVIYKLGVLLYGPQGSGKTSLLREIIHHSIPKNSVIIHLNKIPSSEMVKVIQQSLSDQLKVFVFEELASVLSGKSIDGVLTFLDGEQSIDKSINFATTNYPENLPANIVDRPSRFDQCHKIGFPSDESRKKLLEFYLGREVTSDEVAKTKDMSAASVKEISLMSRRKKISFQEALKRLKKHSDMVKKDFAEHRRIGFSTDDE